MKLVFVLSFLFLSTSGNEEDFRRLDAIRQEPECSSAGGMCTPEDDCPPEQLTARRGLCPKQQSQKIECCHGISQKETRCGKRGGVCLTNDSSCNPRLVFNEATDCPVYHKCCILV